MKSLVNFSFGTVCDSVRMISCCFGAAERIAVIDMIEGCDSNFAVASYVGRSIDFEAT